MLTKFCDTFDHRDIILNKIKYMIYKREVCPKTGKKHYHFYVEFNKTIRFTGIKKIFNDKTIHCEAAVKHRDACENYIMKEVTSDMEPVIYNALDIKPYQDLEDLFSMKEARGYQLFIMEKLLSPPSQRLIYWFYDEVGNTGKTILCKHLCIKHPNRVLLLNGKASDIKYAVAEFVKKNVLEVAIFHFVRSNESYISYDAIESVKDGIFFSPKYESSMCLFDIPHVFIFANFKPNESALSQDRWKIFNIFDPESRGYEIRKLWPD